MSSTISLSDHYATAIRSLCAIAESHYYAGNTAEALRVLQAGRSLIEAKEARPQDRIEMLLRSGKILIDNYFFSNGEFDEIISPVLQAQELAESEHDEQSIITVLSLLGQAHYYKQLGTGEGNFDQAQAYLQQAIERYEALQDTRDINEAIFAYVYMGLTYEQQHLPEQAQEYYQKAYAIAVETQHPLERSYAARHLSTTFFSLGDLEQALTYALESLSLREELGYKRYLSFSNLLVGDIYMAKEQHADALPYYQRAYALAEELDLRNALAFSLLSIGDVYLTNGEKAQARMYYEQADDIARELDIAYLTTEVAQKLQRL
jgi:ATP/maltotriose-dependent transcriptional regulator MalT